MTPITRIERYLNGISQTLQGGESVLPEHPLTRTEAYYNNIAKKLKGESSDKPSVPLCREEQYLDEISDNLDTVGLEDARGHYFGGDSE